MYEYYLKFWGQAEGRIAKKLGSDKRDYFFPTKEDRRKFRQMINEYAGDQVVVFAEYEGKDVRLHTIAYVDARFKGRRYTFEYDFGPGYPVESAEYMFEDGNYSCNCNLSRFIREKYPEFPILECNGDEEENQIEYTFVVEQREVKENGMAR